MNTRKSTSNLSQPEISELVSAFLKLKNVGNPKTGRNYDTYVEWHQKQAMPAHSSPQFLPWHRVFIYLLEKDLQDVSGNPSLSLPYWDWRFNREKCNSIWSDNFLGGNGDKFENWKVKSGSFAFEKGNWALNINDAELDNNKINYLQRSFGEMARDLPTKSHIDRVLMMPNYDIAPFNRESDINKSFRNRLEGWGIESQTHNKGHMWVGGSMIHMTSPNDPVFFLHHCFIDMIWASWQKLHPNETYKTKSPDGIKEKLPPMKNENGEIYTVEDCLDWTKLNYDYDKLIVIDSSEKSMESFDEMKRSSFYS